MRVGPAAVAALALVLLAGGAAPAAAHDEYGDFEIVSVTEHAAGGGSAAVDVTVEARLTYRNDGHPAPSTATVTIIAESAAAADAVGPVIAAPTATEGNFEATLTLPAAGSWTLRVNSLAPIATLDQQIDVAVPPEEPTPTPTPTPSPAATATPTPTPLATPTATAGADPGAGPGDGALWFVASAVIAAVVVGIGALVARRRRGEGPPPAA